MSLTEDDAVFVCGHNGHGELGLGDTTRRRENFSAVPFFGPDHPGLVPISGSVSECTFAAPAAPESTPSSVSPLQEDMMALVSGGDDVLHSDITLVSNDGVSVEANLAMIQARCPKLLQRMAPETEPAAKRPRTSTEITSPSGVDSVPVTPDRKESKITVSEASGQALKGLVTFLYSDMLPGFITEEASGHVVLMVSSQGCRAHPTHARHDPATTGSLALEHGLFVVGECTSPTHRFCIRANKYKKK